MVQLELDRVLVQCTVSAPRYAVGMLASEELARLDLAAEELLESIASKKTALPLAPKMASIAASLATELRLHLIEGRRETWLYHAVSESEMLGKAVTLSTSPASPGCSTRSSATACSRRPGCWSATRSTSNASRTVTLQVGPVAPGDDRRARAQDPDPDHHHHHRCGTESCRPVDLGRSGPRRALL